jgi:c-di-GMP-binding flagellar brake protein YcgR
MRNLQRNSLRFPLHLQATLRTAFGDYSAETIDISAGGILFLTEASIEVGSPVEFAIEMPADVLGESGSVLVRCQGRVVRCSTEETKHRVSVVIDEYRFERA